MQSPDRQLLKTLPKARPDHISLDFERLRAEGIKHLENLATEIWTDFNAHDPGITLLEVLCYALTDLGYRSRLLPIQDLIAGDGSTRQWFEPAEVLCMSPVTANDLRKILIDLDGVKNAWVERARPEDYALKTKSGTVKPSSLDYNGLYRIKIELDDDLDPRSEKTRQRITRRVLNRLNADRGLCQDFTSPLFVQNWHYCLCLDLEVDPNMNEQQVAANVLHRIQEFIVPTVRFYNFKEMRQKGLPSDGIFNGPLLKNGFIHDDELNAAEKLPLFIYRSDLQRIAAETPGVLDVRDLRIKTPMTDDEYVDAWQIEVKHPDMPNLDGQRMFKPLLDACCAKVHILRDGIRQTITGQPLADAYNTLRLAQQALGSGERGGPQAPTGIYRPDLSEYHSVQYDLPEVYAVGRNLPRPEKAHLSRQLQAYLMFYDQILAGYLAQLGEVKRLFSVEQKADDPTQVLQTLFDAPGAMELMGDFARMTFPARAAGAVGIAVQPAIQEIEHKIEAISLKIAEIKAKNEDADISALETEISGLNTEKQSLGQLSTQIEPLIEQTFAGLTAFRLALLEKMGELYFNTYARFATEETWNNFIADPANNIVTELSLMADPPARRQDRRNRLLDHLIARFGESFSTYVATLTRADADPEDNPWRQDFGQYLQGKAEFLTSIPTLGANRGRGFNYRLMNDLRQPAVWDTTDNISGLHQRACALLGIRTDFPSRTLLGELPYRLEITPRNNRQGPPNYVVQLFYRGNANGENPFDNAAILSTNPFKLKSKAEEVRTDLYQKLDTPGLFKEREIDGESDFVEVYFDYKVNEYDFHSRPMPVERTGEMINQLDALLTPPAACDREGCHLIEHILLRPDDESDDVLTISTGSDTSEMTTDPYSFWLTVVLPKEAGRFRYEDFRNYTEQVFRREAPAHIALRFCWLTRDELLDFEPLMEAWLEAKARCQPNDCQVTEKANALILWMNGHTCDCGKQPESLSPCEKPATDTTPSLGDNAYTDQYVEPKKRFSIGKKA